MLLVVLAAVLASVGYIGRAVLIDRLALIERDHQGFAERLGKIEGKLDMLIDEVRRRGR